MATSVLGKPAWQWVPRTEANPDFMHMHWALSVSGMGIQHCYLSLTDVAGNIRMLIISTFANLLDEGLRGQITAFLFLFLYNIFG